MPKYTKAEVGTILENELRFRRADYLKAKKELDLVTEVLSGFPQSDGMLHIKNVGVAHTRALQTYTTALRERGRFVTHGETPVRFQV
jgi:DNA polymerase/3'-5' exonuclease PolX